MTVSTGTLDWERPGDLDRRHRPLAVRHRDVAPRWRRSTPRASCAVGEAFRHEGILGTVFTGRLVEETTVGRVPGGRPDDHRPGLDHRLRDATSSTRPTRSPTASRSATSGREGRDRPHDRRPATAADLAAEAEAAGWDGVFTWDGIAIGDMEIYDPWVVMAAMAMRTERVRLGAIVTPPSRRRPWKLARETMTLDRLSSGRLVLPVGLGALDDGAFGNVGEPTEARIRAELLDEIARDPRGPRGRGEPFGFEGEHYRFEPMTFRPTPVQRPRIPIWVVGAWPNERSVRRALRYDGILPQTSDPAAIAELVGVHRSRTAGATPGRSTSSSRARRRDAARAAAVRALADAGRDLVDRVRLDRRDGRVAARDGSPPGRLG